MWALSELGASAAVRAFADEVSALLPTSRHPEVRSSLDRLVTRLPNQPLAMQMALWFLG